MYRLYYCLSGSVLTRLHVKNEALSVNDASYDALSTSPVNDEANVCRRVVKITKIMWSFSGAVGLNYDWRSSSEESVLQSSYRKCSLGTD